jgi:hypothetical protein
MTEPNDQNRPSSPFDYPEFRQAIQNLAERIPDLLERKMEGDFKERRVSSISMAIFIGLIIVVTGALTYIGRLSSDTVAFIFGAIVGYTFSYLQGWLPS